VSPRLLALALVLLVTAASAEPALVASGSYPEGLLWHGGRLYFTEMGADRVTVIENGQPRLFWSLAGCGPTQIVPFGPKGFVVDCHLGRAMVEVSETGQTGRTFAANRDGQRLQNPNAAASDGQGGAYFSDAGTFDLNAPPTGRVYHLNAAGVMTEVVSSIRYANGVNFDPSSRTLYVSEHLARRVLALTLDARQQVTARRVLIDFAKVPAASSHAHPLAPTASRSVRG
jgi:sugar lactone lactonase YvrE